MEIFIQTEGTGLLMWNETTESWVRAYLHNRSIDSPAQRVFAGLWYSLILLLQQKWKWLDTDWLLSSFEELGTINNSFICFKQASLCETNKSIPQSCKHDDTYFLLYQRNQKHLSSCPKSWRMSLIWLYSDIVVEMLCQIVEKVVIFMYNIVLF